METAATIAFEKIPITINGPRCDFPPILTVDSRGKTRVWKIYVIVMRGDIPISNIPADFKSNKPLDGISANIYTEAGTEDGKRTISSPTIVVSGKNIGKKNQTNAFTQAIRDAYGAYMKYSKSHTKGASTAIRNFIPPMLLNKYATVQRSTIHYEKTQIDPSKEKVFMQPKVNDLRIVSCYDNGVIMYTRRLNPITGFEEHRVILKQMFDQYPQIHLDGGFYCHGMSLQEINSIVRNTNVRDNDNKLEYVLFDCYLPDNPNATFEARFKILNNIYSNVAPTKLVRIIDTRVVHSTDEMISVFNEYLSQKYEGGILRKANGKYTPGYNNIRSNDVLKIKPRLDDEYVVVGFTSGRKGKDKDAIIWILQNSDGKEFMVVPNMSLKERNDLFADFTNHPEKFEKYRGKLMNVEYAELSIDGVPQQAKAIGWRDDL